MKSQVTARTSVAIEGDMFMVNGQPTYAGRYWEDHKIEGLLLNSRMVQATFDDTNPETVSNWAYSDTGKWDPVRNVNEFIGMMPVWQEYGMNSMTLNLQGGNPRGYGNDQPWCNTAVLPDGTLDKTYMDRFKRVLDTADKLGMIIMLGIFYFGQDERLKDESAVKKAVDNTVAWIFEHGYRNVIIEVNNECSVPKYEHEILTPPRVHELIEQVKANTNNGEHLLVGTSYGGGGIPGENVVKASDYLLVHGNGQHEPEKITAMVDKTRAVDGYRPMPIVFNEDDHFDFDKPDNNFRRAIASYASWGYFDYRMKDEPQGEGYQSVPVNWGINTERKKGFFNMVKDVAGL